MKVRFYPRDIEMFRNGDFDFNHNPVLLVYKPITNYKDFYDRQELIDYLKTKDVTLTDHQYPLVFKQEPHPEYGENSYTVKQYDIIGWFIEIV